MPADGGRRQTRLSRNVPAFDQVDSALVAHNEPNQTLVNGRTDTLLCHDGLQLGLAERLAPGALRRDDLRLVPVTAVVVPPPDARDLNRFGLGQPTQHSFDPPFPAL